MELDLTTKLTGRRRAEWESLLAKTGLHPDVMPEETLLVWEDEELIATGSRDGNILKYLAVDPEHQGEDLTATVLTQLRQSAFDKGLRHLFLYTKPANDFMFRSLFFYPIAITGSVLLMESVKNGITTFIDGLEKPVTQGNIGAAVMNCNPFTLGHRYLIETAAAQADHLYIFVLSEDRSLFPAADRIELVRRGTEDLRNVTVLPSGPYLISSATFPTYFLKDRDAAPKAQCGLDIEIFTRYYAPAFGIGTRFLGSEPLSALTDSYNSALAEQLPGRGIAVNIIPRKENEAGPISATKVRSLLHTGQPEELKKLVPETTFEYLEKHDMI